MRTGKITIFFPLCRRPKFIHLWICGYVWICNSKNQFNLNIQFNSLSKVLTYRVFFPLETLPCIGLLLLQEMMAISGFVKKWWDFTNDYSSFILQNMCWHHSSKVACIGLCKSTLIRIMSLGKKDQTELVVHLGLTILSPEVNAYLSYHLHRRWLSFAPVLVLMQNNLV